MVFLQIASIIFIDSPVGTGFSYANTSEGFASSDTKSVIDNYVFLKKVTSMQQESLSCYNIVLKLIKRHFEQCSGCQLTRRLSKIAYMLPATLMEAKWCPW